MKQFAEPEKRYHYIFAFGQFATLTKYTLDIPSMTTHMARIPLPIFLFLTACLVPHAVFAETQQERRAGPNIILLMGDDHGWEETGYHGHPYVKTPFLDEMATSGLRLTTFMHNQSVRPRAVMS